jgi:hypothetical protein
MIHLIVIYQRIFLSHNKYILILREKKCDYLNFPTPFFLLLLKLSKLSPFWKKTMTKVNNRYKFQLWEKKKYEMFISTAVKFQICEQNVWNKISPMFTIYQYNFCKTTRQVKIKRKTLHKISIKIIKFDLKNTKDSFSSSNCFQIKLWDRHKWKLPVET